MLHLESKITLSKEIIQSANLTDHFSEDDLKVLGAHIFSGYEKDEASRFKWKRRNQAAMNLALQVQEAKNFPWPNCSNVAFPLVTIAALQFHSRAYPALVQGPDLVKFAVSGADPDGSQTQRAQRVEKDMSTQLLDPNSSWEEQHDRLLINLPIVGCAFKKSYFSPEEGQNVSELVVAQDLVMDYYAKSVESCMRKTQVIPMFRNEIWENVQAGTFRDILNEPWYEANATPLRTPETPKIDNRTGFVPPASDEDTPFTMLEQHCWLDLDQDGYREPYVVTIEANSRTVVRIVTRFESLADITRNSKGKILRIKPFEYYTKYSFIPSPDGGIYDMGFGVLLGPLNESTNSLINQLIDAGTMANSAGGFLGRGAKLRGGTYTFAPLEWKRVDATGDDLKKSIFPLPVREPSNVLFQLLSLLINYTNRVSGSTDTLMGENPGQNTPAETTNTMVEQGLKIYSAIFKRVWRSMKTEFGKLYVLNGMYTSEFSVGPNRFATRADYHVDPKRIMPAADPNHTSPRARLQQALTIKQAAMGTPGYSIPDVERKFLRALQVDDIDTIYPGPDKVPPLPNPKVQVEQLKLQAKQMQLQADQAKFAAELMEDRKLNQAKILQLEAQAAKFIEEAGGVQTGHHIAAFQAAIGALKAHDASLMQRANLLLQAMETHNDQQTSNGTGMAGMAGAPGNAGAPSGGQSPQGNV